MLPGKKHDRFEAVEGIELYTDDGLAWESEQLSRQNLLSNFRRSWSTGIRS